MFTCPWCGTTYATFRSDCQNCGGPLHMPTPGDDLPAPPPAPRPIAGSYVWRLLTTDGWAVASLVFAILGIVFFPIGAGMLLSTAARGRGVRGGSPALSSVTLLVGLPFAVLGLAFVVAAVALAIMRYRRAQRVLRVLREGDTTLGSVSNLWQDTSINVNGRSPWVIEYEYRVGGQSLQGKVNTMSHPAPALEVGRPVRVLYLAEEPQWSSIYPHP